MSPPRISPDGSRLFRFVGALACAAAMLVACAHLAPDEREFVVGAERLSELLARRLKVEKNLLDVLYVSAGKPVVTLDPASQRLRVDLDLSVKHPFSSRPLTGRSALSGGLGFDASSLTVLLTEPRLERLEIDAVPPPLREPVSRLSAALGRELLSSYPLLTLEPRQLAAQGQEYDVAGIEIVPQGLKIRLRRKP